MKVKICGITRSEDLRPLNNLDPAFIGFINIRRSKRFIPGHKIRELMDEMENPEKSVLVLEPVNVDEVIKKAKKYDIKNVQLHSLSPEEISKIKGIKVIKAIGIPEKMDEIKVEEIGEFSKVCDYLLFDSVVSGKSGGTGKQIPIEVALKAAAISRMNNPRIKLFLAGGMDSKRIENEGEILKEVYDYVDVNSGVEDAPGIKNKHKIKEFMEKCMVIS